MIRISASKLSTYSFCPRRYYYRYVKHIVEPPNELMRRGLAIHELIASIIKNGLLNADDVALTFDKYKIDKSLAKYVLGTVSNVKPFIDKMKFIDAEIKFEKQIGDFIFEGIVDAITPTKLIDWKCVDKVKEFKDPLQLAVYHQIYPDKAPEYVQVTPSRIAEIHFSEVEMNTGWLKVQTLLPKIKRKQYPMHRTSYCERCFYRDMCRT